jgi:CubicO group peptidase (beta-lactamase class C family)
MKRRDLCSCLLLALIGLGPSGTRAAPATARSPVIHNERFRLALERAAQLPHLNALIIARAGEIQAEQSFRGPGLDTPVPIKSISKSVISALVGIAIAQGKLQGVEQPIASFFPSYIKNNSDPRLHKITLGHLLSMQSGLIRTSGPAYAAWVNSKNWVRYILSAPMIAEPGGDMVYSTGNSHLLSAILTRATGKSTYQLARDALAKPLGIELSAWQRDPQGIFMGGNQMQMSAHALLKLGELYRNRGMHGDRQVVPAAWIDATLTPRCRSIFSGQLYGYGWFIATVADQPLFFAWGYGGQFIFVLPELKLTVVTTSQSDGPRDFEHLAAIFELLRETIVPSAATDT